MTVRVALAVPRDASYDIEIGRGLLADLPALLKAACPAGRYAVITDSHVAKLYGEKLVARCRGAGLQVELLEFPAGTSTPALPPIEESIMASSVVGTWMQGMPRR